MISQVFIADMTSAPKARGAISICICG